MDQRQENTRLVAYEARNVRRSVDMLLGSPAPTGAIASLIARAGSPGATAFERYAGLVLRDAGAARLAKLPLGCTVLLSPPAEARLARLTCTSDIGADTRELLSNMEDAINRLCCIADAIEDGKGASLPQPQRIGISFLGAGFLSSPAEYRSALVSLPAIGRAEQPGMAYFNEVDWRVLDHVAATAHTIFKSSVLPNMHQAFMGASGPDGSDWDVRTRLASLLETLELPLGYGYRFDVNVRDQAVSLSFTIPAATAFPSKVADPASGKLVEVAGRLDAARTVYALRLSCLLAAAAFGSGRRLERVFITGIRQSDGAAVTSCAFERKRYVYDTLTAIDSKALLDPALRFDPEGVARLIAPEHLEVAELSSGGALKVPDDGMARQRIEAHLDQRELPDDMRRLFHARRICDIDTQHYHGTGAQAVSEARADSTDSPIAAIAHLEHVIAELERDVAPPDDNADARPIYCANPLARAVVSLLDDDYAVSDQAEAFLRGQSADGPAASAHPSYFRAPDALFHAHMGLSDLYEQLGDIPGSQAHADRCIALAPTTADAYFRKADVLASQARYVEAANVLAAGLRCSVAPRDCALLYYHLALILWNMGRKREAVAVHVYTTSLAGEFAEKAMRVVANLRKRDDSPVIVYASPLAAAREMARGRIPVVPSDAARTLVVKAAVGLSCAGAPVACAPYAAAMASYFRDDRVIASACRSIVHGTGCGKPWAFYNPGQEPSTSHSTPRENEETAS